MWLSGLRGHSSRLSGAGFQSRKDAPQFQRAAEARCAARESSMEALPETPVCKSMSVKPGLCWRCLDVEANRI